MARYCPGFDTDPMFEIAEAIKDRCFRNDESLLSDRVLWTEGNIHSVLDLFKSNLDKGSGKYLEKMERQLESASPEQCQLMAELNYVLQFPQSNIGSERKTETVRTIWNWSGENLDIDIKPFSNEVLQGAFHPGQAYNTLRWKELLYLMRIVLAFKREERDKQGGLLDRPWDFSAWLEEIDQDGSRQFQHILKFLFFPDTFERIVTIKHKMGFIKDHIGESIKGLQKVSETRLDELLLQARDKYQRGHPGEQFDFYEYGDALRAAGVEEPKAEYGAESAQDFESDHPLNVIFYGPPGTGKTHHSMRRAVNIIDGEPGQDKDKNYIKSRYDALVDEGRVAFVTFHQSFSYEDFVEGIKAEANEDGAINYVVQPGIFRELCERSENNAQHGYVLVIDEINRGNVSSIFGELITLLEPSKRQDASDSVSVVLPYSKDAFSVPSNLYILGTMNTADRSLVHLDTALRRRFYFEEMLPDTVMLERLPKIDGVDVARLLSTLNQRIAVLYDRDHAIGHSYFIPLFELSKPSVQDLATIFQNQILPLLEEYFFEDWQRIRQVLADDRKPQGVLPIYTQAMSDQDFYRLMGDDWQGGRSIVWERNHQALMSPETYKSIYE